MQIFILCGSEAVSGGPELAHQLCYILNRNENVTAKMCYVDVKAPIEKCLPIDCDARPPYVCYETDHARSLDEMDRSGNVIIIPEGLTRSHEVFHYAVVLLWWMSVDNYFVSTNGENLQELKEHCLLHLAQSHYAYQFCLEHFEKKRIMMLSDYVNPAHGAFLYPASYRKNIALYNPAKGYADLKPLIDKVNWLEWMPMAGLNLEQMIVVMQMAKIYVDFGNHPGKDRIPREAAVNGCCIITNRKGSAAFYEDVPIPEEYKFATPQQSLDQIDHLMKEICEDFEKHQADFSEYRKWIKEEKARFESEADELLLFLKSIDLNEIR